jgi:hypothetical protein
VGMCEVKHMASNSVTDVVSELAAGPPLGLRVMKLTLGTVLLPNGHTIPATSEHDPVHLLPAFERCCFPSSLNPRKALP